MPALNCFFFLLRRRLFALFSMEQFRFPTKIALETTSPYIVAGILIRQCCQYICLALRSKIVLEMSLKYLAKSEVSMNYVFKFLTMHKLVYMHIYSLDGHVLCDLFFGFLFVFKIVILFFLFGINMHSKIFIFVAVKTSTFYCCYYYALAMLIFQFLFNFFRFIFYSSFSHFYFVFFISFNFFIF